MRERRKGRERIPERVRIDGKSARMKIMGNNSRHNDRNIILKSMLQCEERVVLIRCPKHLVVVAQLSQFVRS